MGANIFGLLFLKIFLSLYYTQIQCSLAFYQLLQRVESRRPNKITVIARIAIQCMIDNIAYISQIHPLQMIPKPKY